MIMNIGSHWLYFVLDRVWCSVKVKFYDHGAGPVLVVGVLYKTTVPWVGGLI
jgi:hypothetical protein